MRAREIYFGLVAFLGVIGQALAGGGPAVDPAWLERARREIPPVIEKYQSLTTRVEEESDFRYAVAPGPSVGKGPFDPGTRRDRVVRLGENMIYEKTEVNEKAPGVSRILLQCENSDYSFALTKHREDSPYVLGKVAPGKAKLPLAAQGGIGIHGGMLDYLRSFLSAIDEKPKYTLKALHFDAAKGLLGAEFKLAAGDNDLEERISVDPANSWRVVERRVETKFLVATDEYTYGFTIGGMPFPTGMKNLSIYRVEQAPPNMEITAKLVSIKLTDKEPYDFRMSAFGFPEPMGMPAVERGRTRWYLWLSLAAAGILVIGGIVVTLKRRYSRASVPAEANNELKGGGP